MKFEDPDYIERIDQFKRLLDRLESLLNEKQREGYKITRKGDWREIAFPDGSLYRA